MGETVSPIELIRHATAPGCLSIHIVQDPILYEGLHHVCNEGLEPERDMSIFTDLDLARNREILADATGRRDVLIESLLRVASMPLNSLVDVQYHALMNAIYRSVLTIESYDFPDSVTRVPVNQMLSRQQG